MLAQQGDYTGAAAAYEKVLEADPNDARAARERAKALLLARSANANVREVRAAAADNPDDVEAQLGVKLLERREDFKTRISIISGCHTGPYALGIACIPKYTTIRL